MATFDYGYYNNHAHLTGEEIEANQGKLTRLR